MSPQEPIDERCSVHGLNPGTELGRYTLGARIEEIRGGERWTARDTTLERDVSLLVMPADSDSTDAALDAARRAANVEAPQLVRILDVGTDAEMAFIAEDGVSGGSTLAETIGTDGLPAEEVRRITGEVATGIEAARTRGLHHLALTPDCVLITSDGRIKVRGLATTAALAGLETEGEEADREDAVAVVALAYAGLTASWPLEGTTSLPASAREGGDLPAPSKVAVGVPGDLDTICRETLVDGKGPESPGDYAAQIAPWSRIPLAGAVRSTGSAAGTAHSAQRGGKGSGTRSAKGGGTGAAAKGAAAAGAAGTSGSADDAGRTSPSTDGGWSEDAETNEIPVHRGDTAGTSGDADSEEGRRRAAAAAAAAAAAGAVGTGGKVIGDRLGKAAKTAQERSRERIVDARLRREAIRADQRSRTSLGAAPVSAELEPPAPLLPAGAGGSPSRRQSNLVLMMMVGLVLIACLVGGFGLTKIGDGSDLGEILAGDGTVLPSSSSSSSTSSSPTSSESSSSSSSSSEETENDEPYAILNAAGYDPQGDGNEHNAEGPLVYDGDSDTAWQTEGYETSDFGGTKDGVGITVDLGQQQEVSQVTLDLPVSLDARVYVDSEPTSSGTEIGSISDESGEVTLEEDEPIEGQYVTVWFTSLSEGDDGRHRAYLSEITVQ